MSGAMTWLHGQRKTELVALADKVGLQDYESYKKADLESALDEHMRANQYSLMKDASLAPFYRRITGDSSPVKRESGSSLILANDTKRSRPRRVTRAREEIEQTDISESEQSKALITRTPHTSLSFVQNVPLPPSPSVVVERIDQQTAQIRTSVNDLWIRLGITEFVENARDTLSSTAAIQTLAILVELSGVQGLVLPMTQISCIPATAYTPAIQLKVPNLFELLEPEFWSISSLWFFTSVLIPLASAYFFNLALKTSSTQRHTRSTPPVAQFDMLSFNVAKALISWLVYSQGVRFYGLVGNDAVEKLNGATPGGYRGVLIGAGICSLTSVYEAVLNK